MQTTERQSVISSISDSVQSTSVDSPGLSPLEAKLPLIPANEITMGMPIEGDLPGLNKGMYQGQPITLAQVTVAVLPSHRASLAALMQNASPFWLSIRGISEEEKSSTLVLAALPNTWLSTWLSTPAAIWPARCRLVRDVAVGLYQRRLASATHITWDSRQLYLDQQGRAQLVPLLSETPVEEADEVLALGQLIWQVVSGETALAKGWQQGKGLPKDCPPAVVKLIQACTDLTVSARPSLKVLAKGLDVFWQWAEKGLSDATPAIPTLNHRLEKEKKYEVSTGRSSIAPVYQLGDLVSASPLLDMKQTSSVASVLINILAEDPSQSSSIAFTSKNLNDSVLASSSLNLLLIDDQTVRWLSPTDPRYQVSVKLCELRDSLESKASLPALQRTIQATLIESHIEVLLWVSEEGEAPDHAFTETAWRLWQAPAWQSYRPGDPPPESWLPLFIHYQSQVTSPVLTRAHHLSTEDTTDFTESEWQVLQNQYALFWLVQGMSNLEPCNLYGVNELHRAQGRMRLLLHSEKSVTFKLEESTYFMPHGTEGQLLPACYARYTTDPACDFSAWEGRYQGRIGSEAQETTPTPIALTPAKDLALNRDQLTLDEKTTLGKGAFGEVVRGSYYGQPVAVKRFKEAKLSASDQAQLKDEAKVMAELQSPFLIRSLGLSLEMPPLLVMELAQGGNLYDLLKDQNKEFPWVWRLRVLRDIALGLSVLHAHELLHRDLKSLNILLNADGRAKLCDFGLSTLKSQAKDTSDVGTLLWNAPEVLQGKAATPACDIYSFAIICWEVVTRRLPYSDSKTGQLGGRGWQEQVLAPLVIDGRREVIPTDCPLELAIVIEACWAQDPSQRPTANQVAQVLEDLWQQTMRGEQSQSGLKQPTSRFKKSIPAYQPKIKENSTKVAPVFSGLSPEALKSLMTDSLKKGAPIEKKTDPPAKQVPTLCLPVGSQSAVAEFKILLGQSPTPNWHDKELPQYTLGVKLQHFREKVLTNPFITQELSCYIEPNGQSQAGIGQSSAPLYPWVEREFLCGPAQVLLLQGVAGAGKSTFNRNLLRELWQDPAWQAYLPGDPLPPVLIPVWIPLGSIQVKQDDFWDYLRQEGLTGEEIWVLKTQGRLIFIADGYDEIPRKATPNLYDLNRFGDEKSQGRIKLIVGCRSQHVQSLSEAEMFVPKGPNGLPNWIHYRSRYIAPFTPQQMKDYIAKYVHQRPNDPDHPKDWDMIRYEKALFKEIPGLASLIHTPFMLLMILSILPALAREQRQSVPQKHQTTKESKGAWDEKEQEIIVTSQTLALKITCSEIYDRFMEGWFTNAARKASRSQKYLKKPEEVLGVAKVQALREKASQSGSDDVQVLWLAHAFRAFCLAFARQLHQSGQMNIYHDSADQKEKSLDGAVALWGDALRQGCPIQEAQDHTWEFIHASFLDYFLIVAIVEGLVLTDATLVVDKTLLTCSQEQAIQLLAKVHITPEQARFFMDRVMGQSALQEALFAIIERSKTDPSIAIASANAATVLNACQISFAGKDWRGVQVPGANLSYGIFSKGHFEGANFEGAFLKQTIWYKANLKGANLGGIRWGEWPCLKIGSDTDYRAVVFHPVQPWLAVASQSGDIFLIDRQTGEYIGEPFSQQSERNLHGPGLGCLAFSTDGRYLASGECYWGGNDKFRCIVRLWDVATRQPLIKPLKHHSFVECIAFSPEGRYLASGTCGKFKVDEESDHDVYLWDITINPPKAKRYKGNKYQMKCVTFSHNGEWLASGSWDAVRLLNIASGHILDKPLNIYGFLSCVAFSPDDKFLILGDATGIHVWNLAMGCMLENLVEEDIRRIGTIYCVAFSPDGKLMVSGGSVLCLWDVATWRPIGELFFGPISDTKNVLFSPDGKSIIATNLSVLYRWDIATHPLIKPFTAHICTSSPDGKILVSVSGNTVRFWDSVTLNPLGEPLIGSCNELQVAFSPNGQLLCLAGYDNTLSLWNVATRSLVGEPFKKPVDPKSMTSRLLKLIAGTPDRDSIVKSMVFSPDGKTLALISDGQTLHRVDVVTGRSIDEFKEQKKKRANSVAFSPNGNILAIGGRDKTIRLFEVSAGSLIGKPLQGHTEQIDIVAFSPDGKFLVSGGIDGLHLWDMITMQQKWEVQNIKVSGVLFSSDGRYLLSKSPVQLWNRADNTSLAVLPWPYAIISFTLSHQTTEGDILIICDEKGIFCFWKVLYQEPGFDFLGMPPQNPRPLLFAGANLLNCRLDQQGKRLIKQYNTEIDTSEVVIVDDLPFSVSTLETKASSSSTSTLSSVAESTMNTSLTIEMSLFSSIPLSVLNVPVISDHFAKPFPESASAATSMTSTEDKSLGLRSDKNQKSEHTLSFKSQFWTSPKFKILQQTSAQNSSFSLSSSSTMSSMMSTSQSGRLFTPTPQQQVPSSSSSPLTLVKKSPPTIASLSSITTGLTTPSGPGLMTPPRTPLSTTPATYLLSSSNSKTTNGGES